MTLLGRKLTELAPELSYSARKAVKDTGTWMYHCRLDRDAAEDLVQQTWAVALAKLEYYSSDAQLRGFFKVTAQNLTLAHLRGQRQAPAPLPTGEDGQAEPAAPALSEDDAIARELAEKTLASLSAKDQLILIWRYSDGLTLDEIAGAESCSVPAIKMRLHRCRRSIVSRFALAVTKGAQDESRDQPLL